MLHTKVLNLKNLELVIFWIYTTIKFVLNSNNIIELQGLTDYWIALLSQILNLIWWPGCKSQGIVITSFVQNVIPAANSPSKRDAVHRLSGNSFYNRIWLEKSNLQKLRYSRSIEINIQWIITLTNNSPAEWTSPENGWRWSEWPKLNH